MASVTSVNSFPKRDPSTEYRVSEGVLVSKGHRQIVTLGRSSTTCPQGSPPTRCKLWFNQLGEKVVVGEQGRRKRSTSVLLTVTTGGSDSTFRCSLTPHTPEPGQISPPSPPTLKVSTVEGFSRYLNNVPPRHGIPNRLKYDYLDSTESSRIPRKRPQREERLPKCPGKTRSQVRLFETPSIRLVERRNLEWVFREEVPSRQVYETRAHEGTRGGGPLCACSPLYTKSSNVKRTGDPGKGQLRRHLIYVKTEFLNPLHPFPLESFTKKRLEQGHDLKPDHEGPSENPPDLRCDISSTGSSRHRRSYMTTCGRSFNLR